MSVVNSTPLLAAAGGEYQISRSVRLRSSAGGRFSRTPAGAGNRQVFTFSAWVKRGLLSNSASYALFSSPQGANDWFTLGFSNDSLVYDVSWTSAANRIIQVSVNLLRDPSAWYHVVCQVDTTQATGSNRIRIYINSQLITSYTYVLGSGSIAQNTNTNVNTTNGHGIGFRIDDNDQYLDGYLTEVNFIDGQALTPSSFGETDVLTGVWKPKKYAGTYGTNGFYLNFSDNSAATAAAIGKDSSGNGNNWTPNNISVTSGVTYDSMLDVPTLWADGGNGRGNYAVLDPLIPPKTSGTTSRSITNGNLYGAATGGAGWSAVGATITATSGSGKWYWEVNYITANDMVVGIHRPFTTTATFPDAIIGYTDGADVNGYAYHANTGNKFNNGSTAYGASYTAGDVIGVALDMSTAGSASITFYKNNTSQGVAFSGLTGDFFPCFSATHASAASINFGQRPFAYTPPTGFKALNTQNLPEPVIDKGGEHFNAVLYTGNGSTNNITGVGFQPDFVWLKARSAGGFDHVLQDVIRGSTRQLYTNTTDAEVDDTDAVTSFNSDGFTSGADVTTNNSGTTYVAWNWKANGAGVTNTDGSITSTVSANPTAGFSIVTYTGTGSNATVGHGLGVAPRMIILRAPNVPSAWVVYHASTGNTGALQLQSTGAFTSFPNMWNNTTPTSSVFTIGTDPTVNGNGNLELAYCFAEVPGYSRFGSYTGNGSADGPFVFCEFRPAFILWKRTDSTADWTVFDTARDTYNVAGPYLNPNTSAAELTDSTVQMDLLSNGFKVRGTWQGVNASGGTFIFMAFAESPFKNALAR